MLIMKLSGFFSYIFIFRTSPLSQSVSNDIVVPQEKSKASEVSLDHPNIDLQVSEVIISQ